MTTYRYQECTVTAKRTVRCIECNKRLTRQTTFMQTRNPFNKNAEGLPKSYAEIYRELNAAAATWMPDPQTCGTCANTGAVAS